MAERRAIVRSYQRLFRPDRRIYAIDGRTLPIPGGLPLRWLAYVLVLVVGMLVIAGHSPAVMIFSGGAAYMACSRLGRPAEGRRIAVLAAGRRPQWHALVTAGMARRFDVVLVFDEERVSRPSDVFKHYKNVLTVRHGIELVSVTSGGIDPVDLATDSAARARHRERAGRAISAAGEDR